MPPKPRLRSPSLPSPLPPFSPDPDAHDPSFALLIHTTAPHVPSSLPPPSSSVPTASRGEYAEDPGEPEEDAETAEWLDTPADDARREKEFEEHVWETVGEEGWKGYTREGDGMGWSGIGKGGTGVDRAGTRVHEDEHALEDEERDKEDRYEDLDLPSKSPTRQSSETDADGDADAVKDDRTPSDALLTDTDMAMLLEAEYGAPAGLDGEAGEGDDVDFQRAGRGGRDEWIGNARDDFEGPAGGWDVEREVDATLEGQLLEGQLQEGGNDTEGITDDDAQMWNEVTDGGARGRRARSKL